MMQRMVHLSCKYLHTHIKADSNVKLTCEDFSCTAGIQIASLISAGT